MSLPIYLDNNASTPVDPRVLDVMLPYLQDNFGNPSSRHSVGQQAMAALNHAREQVAALVGVHPSQVIFTSGGTEANNLAIRGVAARNSGVIAASAIEHSSVIEPVKALARSGRRQVSIGVNSAGVVTEELLQAVIDEAGEIPSLVSVMLANNETGAVQDLGMIAERFRESSTVVHTDAVQMAGKASIDFNALGVHMMSLSAHKIYGPKGVGALVVDKSVDREPLLVGGQQENGCRAGTENVAGIAGFGMAAELALQELKQNRQHFQKLGKYLEQRLGNELPQAVVFSRATERLPNTVFLAIPGIDGETLLICLDQSGMAISSGSACESASMEPSHVLMAMGVESNIARCAIRVSIGKDNSMEDIDAFMQALKQHVDILQAMPAVMPGL